MTESPESAGKPETTSGAPETQPPAAPQQSAPQGYPPPYPYQGGPYQGGYQGYQGYPGGYPAPPPQPYSGYTPPPTGPKNGLGIASLVIAIVALVSSFSVFGGIILGIVAVVMGFAARGRVKRGDANNGGVAIAGIVLGFVSIVAGLAFIAIWVGVFNQVGGGDYVDCVRKAGQDQEQVNSCARQFKEHVENKFSITLTPSP
jgi:hypothetical protein